MATLKEVLLKVKLTFKGPVEEEAGYITKEG